MNWIKSKIWNLVIGVIIVLVFLGEVFRRGSKWNELKRDQKDIKKERKGREEVSKEQTETDGLSTSDVVERMRRRNDRWTRM